MHCYTVIKGDFVNSTIENVCFCQNCLNDNCSTNKEMVTHQQTTVDEIITLKFYVTKMGLTVMTVKHYVTLREETCYKKKLFEGVKNATFLKLTFLTWPNGKSCENEL